MLSSTVVVRSSQLLWLKLMLAGLAVLLVFGACSSSYYTSEDAQRQAPLVVRYHVRKTTSLFVLDSYDTLGYEVLYQGRSVVPRNLCRPDTALPVVQQLLRVPQSQTRWLLRVQCSRAWQATYLLRLTTAGLRIRRVGADEWANARAEFLLLADGKAVYVPHTENTGALLDLETLHRTTTVFPAIPDSLKRTSTYFEAHYSLAPNRQVLARFFSPDTSATWLPDDHGVEHHVPAPQPAIYLDELDVRTGQLHRQRLPYQMLATDEVLRQSRWQQDATGHWHFTPPTKQPPQPLQ